MKKIEIKKELLYQYFDGRATPLDKSKIEDWLKVESNQEYFFGALEEWEMKNAQFTPDRLDGLKQLMNKIHHVNSSTDKTGNHKVFESFWISKWRWLIAACVLTLIGAGILFSDSILYKTYHTGFGETKTFQIDDGSLVTLNANSSVMIPRQMGWRSKREVWTNGELFFNVEKKSNGKTFTVHTRHLDIVVIGTRFNIDDRHQTTKVMLEEGKVKIKSNSGSKETLALLDQSGDYLESDGNSKNVVTKKVDQSLYTTWQDRKLKFEDTPVSVVLKSIRDYYGINIHCTDEAILERKFTGTLPNDNLDIVLSSLSNIYATNFKPETRKNVK